MLVTFSCKSYENITMFGDVAKRLLNMMGHSGDVPGAIVADEVPVALEKLQHSLELEKKRLAEDCNKGSLDDDYVSLPKRAVPIVALLNAALKAKNDVMWEYGANP